MITLMTSVLSDLIVSPLQSSPLNQIIIDIIMIQLVVFGVIILIIANLNKKLYNCNQKLLSLSNSINLKHVNKIEPENVDTKFNTLLAALNEVDTKINQINSKLDTARTRIVPHTPTQNTTLIDTAYNNGIEEARRENSNRFFKKQQFG